MSGQFLLDEYSRTMQWAKLRMISWETSHQPLCHFVLFSSFNYGSVGLSNLFLPRKTKKGRLILISRKLAGLLEP